LRTDRSYWHYLTHTDTHTHTHTHTDTHTHTHTHTHTAPSCCIAKHKIDIMDAEEKNVVGTLENFWPGHLSALCCLVPAVCSLLSYPLCCFCSLVCCLLLGYSLICCLLPCLLSAVCSSGTLKNSSQFTLLSCMLPCLNSCLLSNLYAPLSPARSLFHFSIPFLYILPYAFLPVSFPLSILIFCIKLELLLAIN
jgi:hypothetical protein